MYVETMKKIILQSKRGGGGNYAHLYRGLMMDASQVNIDPGAFLFALI